MKAHGDLGSRPAARPNIDYRPVKLQPMTNDVQSFPPRQRGVLRGHLRVRGRKRWPEFSDCPPIPRSASGETYKAAAGTRNIKKFKVYRWTPDDGRNPRSTPTKVDTGHLRGPMVLDAPDQIKNEIDSSLTFRRSLSVEKGVCGLVPP